MDELREGYKKIKGIGWIPNDWNISSVGESCDIKNSLRKPISELERKKIQGEYPYYGPTKVLDYISECNIEGKNVLIGEDGDHFLKYKDQSMTLLVEGKYNVNNHAHILHGTDECLTEWIFHFFRHRNLFSSLTRQGAGRYKLTKEALSKLPIVLPPLLEQEKISKILLTWDDAMGKIEAFIEEKKTVKKGLIQRLLGGTYRFNRYKDKWEDVYIGDFIVENKEKTIYKDQYKVLTSSKRGMYLQNAYFSKQVASENNIGYRVIKRGQFTYRSMSDSGEFTFNRQNIIDIGCVSPAYSVFSTKKDMDSDFLYYMLNSDNFSRLIKMNIQGGTRLAFRFSELKKIRVSLPKLEEQCAISNVLTTVDKEISLLEEKLEILKEQKKGIMQDLLTGKVRVKV